MSDVRAADTARRLSRRDWLGGAMGAAAATLYGQNAYGQARPTRGPVLYLSHGAPIFAIRDPVRIAELQSWGAQITKPRAILAITPHYAARRLEVGATGRGLALYDLPESIARRVPRGLDYSTPPSDALARRVEDLLSARGPVARGDRAGFDHTTWMPLKCLFPEADVPVLELAYPYVGEADAFAIGRLLAPLREEGVLLLASGGMTHNLAAVDFEAPTPHWAKDFDAWAAETIEAQAIDSLIDWRQKAPAADLAHPDDGGHFRVLFVALGSALGQGGSAARVRFPVTGFEATMSKRSVEIL
jgi:4,5-DOPA dioxygenase extradiol